MPIRPAPFVMHCSQCDWKGLFAPRSDCLLLSAWKECPKCGNTKLESKPSSIADTALAQLGIMDRR